MRPVVLLDLDRTLVDVENHVDYCAALDELRAAGFTEDADLGPETSWGTCTRTVVDLLLSCPSARRRQAEDLVVPHEVVGARAATAMPGLDALRTALDDRLVAIVTLLSGPATEVVVDRFRLWDTTVPRHPDLAAKPAPDQLQAALQALRRDPDEAVMLGDSERDAAAAAAAGVAFIGITNGRADHRFGDVAVVVDDLVGALDVL